MNGDRIGSERGHLLHRKGLLLAVWAGLVLAGASLASCGSATPTAKDIADAMVRNDVAIVNVCNQAEGFGSRNPRIGPG